jgi:hypothetical protein
MKWYVGKKKIIYISTKGRLESFLRSDLRVSCPKPLRKGKTIRFDRNLNYEGRSILFLN